MAKRNISYIKPQEPEFIRELKRQAGYDDRNHKFDELQNAEGDFVDDDESEQPQVVVLKAGDLTAEEADIEKKKIEEEDKKDLSKVCFIPKKKAENSDSNKKRKQTDSDHSKSKKDKKNKPVLSFDFQEDEDS